MSQQSGTTISEMRSYIGKSNTIDNLRKKKLIKIKEIKYKNSRFDRFKNFINERNRRYSGFFEKSRSLTKIKDNKLKYKKVIKDVNSLINNLEMNNTKSTFHRVTVKDSFLNSYKNFIVINKYDQFRDGIPVLQLKKDDFFEKAKYHKTVRIFFTNN
jgi:hypothetical protein